MKRPLQLLSAYLTMKFRYHAHSEVQRGDGLYGALVVHDDSAEIDSYANDKELLLLVGDWYHRPAEWILARFQDRSSTGNEVSFPPISH